MGAWTKYFIDGTIEIGSDYNISRGLASWSKGRLDNIKMVDIYENDNAAGLSISDTNWHQLDRFVAAVQPGPVFGTRTHRVVQAEIKHCHVGCTITHWRINKYNMVKVGKTIGSLVDDYSIPNVIPKSAIGKWLTVVVSADGSFSYGFAEKNKFNVD